MSYCRSQIIYVQTIRVLNFSNNICMFGSKIIVIYLYEDYSYNRKLKRIIYTRLIHMLF